MTRLWFPPDRSSRLALILIATLLLVRLGLVLGSPLELYADEAQYWRWGDTLDWGYYSKPPLIAWVIHVSTGLFGDSEASVRLLAPVLHAGAAFALWALARRMLGPSPALVAVAAYVFMPGIVLSSTVISTDGILFPFWSLGLYLLWRLREAEADWRHAILLGACIGFGFLAKYAMLYFVIGLALVTWTDRPTRHALLTRLGGLTALTALLVFTPHLLWNAANSFQTVSHTVDNANLGGELFHLDHLAKFLGDQMGVFGPVSFLALLAGLTMLRRERTPDEASRENWLTCFILPVLVIIAIQAVLSRAHANWAATAYPAGCVLIASVFSRVRADRRIWFLTAGLVALAIQVAPDLTLPVKGSLGLGIGAALLGAGALARWRPVGLFWSGVGLHIALTVFLAAVTLGPAHWVSAAGLDNTFKRTRGWADLSAQLIAEAERLTPTAILVDEREVWHGLDYYTRHTRPAPLILWRYLDAPKNFAEQRALTEAMDERVLVASYRPHRRPQIRDDFRSWTPLGQISVDLGHRSNGCPLNRTLHLYLASGFQPRPRTQEWFAAYQGETLDAPPPCPPPPLADMDTP